MRTVMTAVIVVLVPSLAFAADRPVTDAERTRLEAAVKAEGCSGGRFEFDVDDNEFEVDDAVCADGKKYDFDFDPSYKLIRKKPD